MNSPAYTVGWGTIGSVPIVPASRDTFRNHRNRPLFINDDGMILTEREIQARNRPRFNIVRKEIFIY